LKLENNEKLRKMKKEKKESEELILSTVTDIQI
jgi:hypothetical protein